MTSNPARDEELDGVGPVLGRRPHDEAGPGPPRGRHHVGRRRADPLRVAGQRGGDERVDR